MELHCAGMGSRREKPEAGHAYEDVHGAEAFFGTPAEAKGGPNKGRDRKERAAAEAGACVGSAVVPSGGPFR